MEPNPASVTDLRVTDDVEDAAFAEVTNARARYLRGGSFFNQTTHLRAAYRHWIHPNHMDDNNGFRPARTVRRG